MSRSITISIILLALIGFSIFSLFRLQDINQEMTDLLTSASLAAQNQEFEKAKELSKKCIERWHEHEHFAGIFIRHNEIDEMTGLVSQLKSFIEQKNTALFCGTADRAITLINHIFSSELPTLTNIF
ncbi:MAG: hypothetical protein K0R90_1053 [Oscillospiraceae bacterium]|jgi:cAMP phosphodiesterase|nr:hypothetical protein [Oscillospiraceae bacterium]